MESIIPFYYSKFYQFLPVQLRFNSWLLLYAGAVIFSNLAFPLIKVMAKFPFPSCPSAPKSLHQHVWYVLSSQKQAPYSHEPKLWNGVPSYLCSLPCARSHGLSPSTSQAFSLSAPVGSFPALCGPQELPAGLLFCLPQKIRYFCCPHYLMWSQVHVTPSSEGELWTHLFSLSLLLTPFLGPGSGKRKSKSCVSS